MGNSCQPKAAADSEPIDDSGGLAGESEDTLEIYGRYIEEGAGTGDVEGPLDLEGDAFSANEAGLYPSFHSERAASPSSSSAVGRINEQAQDSVWDASNKLVSDIDVDNGSAAKDGNKEEVLKNQSNPDMPSASASSSPKRAVLSSDDVLGAELASIEVPTLESKPLLGNNAAPIPVASLLTQQPTRLQSPSSPRRQPEVREDGSGDSKASAKIEAMSKFTTPAVAPSDYGASRLVSIPVLSDVAERQAKSIFQCLDKDLRQEALDKITEECFKFPLSRDRVAVVLEQSTGARLTCAQLRTMVEMVSLDAHKKKVIFERYAQLVDKDHFHEQILNNFTRSNALRGILMKEMSKALGDQNGNINRMM